MNPDSERHELARCKRVADQMITAHAILEQRNRVFATSLDIGLMAASLILVITSVVALFRDTFEVWSVRINLSIVTIAGSALVFVLSVAEWRVRWKLKASKHAEARKEYSKIKLALLRSLADVNFGGAVDVRGVLRAYEDIGSRVVSIPEAEFLALKQVHMRKVYVSRVLDRYPFAFRWLITFHARLKDSRRVMKHEDD